MIQITYNEMGDMMFLRAEGHADFAPKGQDIVCAAVSALMQTLAYSLDSGTVTCADDRNLMVVQAKQGTDSLAKFELVTDGLILLADAYPEHVQYINLHADKADAIDLQLFADGGTGANGDGTSQSPGGDSSPSRGAKTTGANGEGNAIELPALRPAEERLARRSGVLKRSSREEGSPSQSAQSAASSPEGGALGSEEKSELDEEAAENQNEAEGKDGEEKGEGKTKSPEERRKAFGELLRGEYADLTEELMQNAVTEATRRLEASPAMKGLMQALQEKYGTDANDLVALTEAVRNGAVKDDAYYEKLAMEKGVSTKTARELDKLESQNKQLTEQQQLIRQMERQREQQARIAELQAGWDREAEQLKAQYPDFNMAEVLANPEVEKMMRSGVSMTNAYRSAYFDHILKQQQAATAQQVEQGVVNRMQQRNARPGENGTRPGGAVQTKIDVSHMSRKEMEEMEKRAMRGEVITL
ncbi:ribosomal-processing cysteine protease Prp [Faecalibacterium prausnitzii]|uniref:ribosomal-processing cysteine protease Prp n=1 Tax=Faecalibacterium prausnitzii TaxID=853 RepID=UPI0012DFC3C8|nr:ribosomal-processing cysteine protease Prp [Faecalibacterium prausnitzii]